MINYKKFLETRYNEIWDSSKKDLLTNNIDVDEHLFDLEKDKRRGLTVLIPLKGECLDKMEKIIDQLKEIEPNQYYYPKTDIHITVLDIISASDDFRFDRKQAAIYKEILDNCLSKFSKFTIQFRGLTASKSAVMVQGFYDQALPKLREMLREEIKEQGVGLKERYKIKTAHLTIARFKQKLQNPDKLVKKIEKNRKYEFGLFVVKKILFVLHGWYNCREKTRVLGEYN